MLERHIHDAEDIPGPPAVAQGAVGVVEGDAEIEAGHVRGSEDLDGDGNGLVGLVLYDEERWAKIYFSEFDDGGAVVVVCYAEFVACSDGAVSEEHVELGSDGASVQACFADVVIAHPVSIVGSAVGGGEEMVG